MKRLLKLLTLLCVFSLSLTANAQFSKTFESYPKGYNPTLDASFDLTAIANILGTDAATLNEALMSWLDGSGSINLIFLEGSDGTRYDNYTVGSNGGFWMTAQGTPTGWTGDVGEDVWYNTFSISPVDNALNISIGQHPDALTGGEELNAKFVLVFNKKEVFFDITLKIKQLPEGGMTEVGSQEIVLEQYPTEDYSSLSFSLDIDAISYLLDAEITDITLWAPTEDGGMNNSPSAGNDGFWFSKDGYRSTWGSSCGIYVENTTAGDFSQFNVGQYPAAFEGGETAKATLFFVAGTKFYTVNILMKILQKDNPTVKNESVAERDVFIQVVPANVYTIDMRYDIDPAELEALIGTTAPTLYARKAPAEGSEWVDELDDRYSCDPKPGFWMSTEGYRSTWGTSGTNWGISYLDDSSSDLNKEGVHQFEFFQMPNTSQVGDEYNAVVYLANEETGKMIAYNIIIQFVEKITPLLNMEKKGELEYDLRYEPLMRYDLSYLTVDADYLQNALGCNDLSEIQMMALDRDGELTDIYTAEDWSQNVLNQGFWFDIDGQICEWGDNDAIYFTRNMDTYSTLLTIGQTTNGLPVGTTTDIQLFFVYENKYVSADFLIEIIEPTVLEAKDYAVVGRQSVDFQVTQTEDFSYVVGNIDYQAIATALGCKNEEYRYYSLAADGTLVYNKTAKDQGYWYNSKNQVITFTDEGTNDEAYYIEQTDGQGDFAVVRVGIYPNHLPSGGNFSATHYLIYGKKAYLVDFNITVLPLGDANCDGSVDVVDVTTTVDFILGKTQPTDKQIRNTDVNKDNSIDVVDLTSIVSIILGTYQPITRNLAPARIQTNDVLLLNGTDITLQNTHEYVAFQMDVTLEDGAVLNGVQLSQRAADKNVTFRRIADNTYRIIAYSLDNSPFTGSEGTLFSLSITGNQQVSFSNILFSDGTKAYTLGAEVVTGINGFAIDAKKTAVYDLNGRKLNKVQKGGIYVVNGKKVSVK